MGDENPEFITDPHSLKVHRIKQGLLVLKFILRNIESLVLKFIRFNINVLWKKNITASLTSESKGMWGLKIKNSN